MGIFSIFIGVIGLVYSLILFLRYRSLQVITYFERITQNSFEFNINSEKRRFSIGFVGGKSIYANKNFTIELTNQNGKKIDIEKLTLMPRYYYGYSPVVQAYAFTAAPGSYKLVFNNLDDLQMKRSMLIINQILQGSIKHDRVGLLIKEAITNREIFVMIILPMVSMLVINYGLIKIFI